MSSPTRRALLKLLPALPFFPQLVVNGQTVSAGVQVAPRFLVMFFDAAVVDVEELVQLASPVPELTIEYVPLRLRHGQKLEDAVKIFEVSGPS